MVVAEVPDVARRLSVFRESFVSSFRAELSRFEARVDATQDLRRVVKVWGTAKPGGRLSRFLGGARVEDVALRQYLLGLEVSVPERPVGLGLLSLSEPPSWLRDALARDGELARLWRGEGKPVGTDGSQSGYDFSVARRLFRLGYTDVSEIASVVVARPGSGAAEKGEAYVRRTVGNALIR